MDHLAILSKSSDFLEKIKSGEKTVESRWYKTRRNPWNGAESGDSVYFKDSGCPVTLKGDIRRVLQYGDLTAAKIDDILSEFGSEIGIEDIQAFSKRVNDKNYCILIFLENIEEVDPFPIDKSGFGIMTAWITVESIDEIKD